MNPKQSHLFFLRTSIVVIFVTMAYLGLFSKRGYTDYLKVKRQNEDLLQKIQQANLDKDYLSRKIEGFYLDDRMKEKVVRQIFGYAKKGEAIVEFK